MGPTFLKERERDPLDGMADAERGASSELDRLRVEDEKVAAAAAEAEDGA
jgi:hypothetical protein